MKCAEDKENAAEEAAGNFKFFVILLRRWMLCRKEMEQVQMVTAEWPVEVEGPATLTEGLSAIMSRVDGTQAEDRGRTETPDVIPADGSDKAAVAGKAVGIDGKKISGSRGPGFFYN